jgi:uncharacterized protein (TIGR03792 family)
MALGCLPFYRRVTEYQKQYSLSDRPMVIEWLKFTVAPELREQFVQKDAEIWTTVLASYPGFLNKEVWISPDRLQEVVAVIRWETLEQWQAIPVDVLEQTEAQFAAAMGDTYKMLEADKFQVRKFS